jgi:biopolymer transport protein ExbD
MFLKHRNSYYPGLDLRDVDLIPFINVLFLIIIFLSLVCAMMVIGGGVSISLPRIITAEGMVYENIELLINSTGTLYLNGKSIEKDELVDVFSQLSKRKVSLLIKSDKNVPLGKVLEVCSLAKSRGITTVNIATNR